MNDLDQFSVIDRHFHNIDEMLKDKTVFFLGAGSSNPYGLPLGNKLQELMLTIYNDNNLSQSGFDGEQIKLFKKALQYNKYDTIDEFLKKKFNFRELGSFSVANTILSLEDETNLFSDRGWYGGLIDSLNFEREIPNISNLTIITLNYDRSLEHFLKEDIEHNCDHNAIDLARVTRDLIKIYHPHGCIGDLHDIGYGINKVNTDFLKKAAKNIKITSDNLSNFSDYQKSISALRKAQNIIFLGFGYDENILKNFINDTFTPDKTYLGTAVNIQPKRIDEIKSFFDNNISLDITNKSCKQYLESIGINNN